LNIIFDAMFGGGWVSYLRSFFLTHKEPRPRLVHIYDIFAQDVKDDVWIPQLIGQDWIVISGDAGRKPPRLPELCRQKGKTHIILSSTLKQETGFVKARAVVVLWPEIVRAADAPTGTRFQMQTIDAAHERFRLVRKR